MSQANWLHRTETQGIHTSSGQLLNRQAGFKPASLLKTLQRDALGVNQSLIKGCVLLFVQQAIEVVVAAFVITSGPKGNIQIDGIGGDYRSDSIVKIELVAAGQLPDRRSQGFRRERTGGDDGDVSLRNVFDF